MEEAERLADRIVVIARRADHRRGHAGHARRRRPRRRRSSPSACPTARPRLPLPAGAEVERRDGRIAFRTAAPTRDLAPLVAWAADRGVELDDLTVPRPSLEDVYLELTEESA